MNRQMATNPDLRKFEALLRTDFRAFLEKVFSTLSPGQSFIPAWHLEAITWQLERIRRGKIRRLIINMPPRSLKSITASVAYPAFVLGHDPSRRIICVSYSGDLAGDGRTIGPRIRISRPDGVSARCNASRARAQPRSSSQPTPPSTTLSTSNAISRQLNHTACYAPRR
jgi:hypothetical protein